MIVQFADKYYLLMDKIRGHTLITLACRGTYLVSKIGQNANIVNKAYLVNMLARLLTWSKIVKNVLT